MVHVNYKLTVPVLSNTANRLRPTQATAQPEPERLSTCCGSVPDPASRGIMYKSYTILVALFTDEVPDAPTSASRERLKTRAAFSIGL